VSTARTYSFSSKIGPEYFTQSSPGVQLSLCLFSLINFSTNSRISFLYSYCFNWGLLISFIIILQNLFKSQLLFPSFYTFLQTFLQAKHFNS
jgi:hypothetical protein